MSKLRALLFFVGGVTWLAVPAIAAAQGLVPCDGISCDLCDIGVMMQRIINFLIAMSIPIAAAMFAYAGFLYVTGATSPEKIGRAHKVFRNVLIGFLITISAWLVVQTLLSMVFDKTFWIGGNWNELKCISESSEFPGENKRLIGTSFGDLIRSVIPQPTRVPDFNGTFGSGSIGGTQTLQQNLVDATTCVGCERVAGGFQIKNGSQVTPAYNQFLTNFERQLAAQGLSSNNIAITEAWPPTSTHVAGCHVLGSCTDIGLRGVTYTSTSVTQVQAAASAAGGCAVYETSSQAACAGISSCKVYAHVTAPHFSLYSSSSCR